MEEIEDPYVRTTYQYVLNLKDRLQTMSELAKKKTSKNPHLGTRSITTERLETDLYR